jgi:hypothetical protein
LFADNDIRRSSDDENKTKKVVIYDCKSFVALARMVIQQLTE